MGSSGQSVLFLLPTEAEFVKCLNEQNISVEEMKIGDILHDALKLVPYLPEIDNQVCNTPKIQINCIVINKKNQ